jgi:fimbrial chaperone protein
MRALIRNLIAASLPAMFGLMAALTAQAAQLQIEPMVVEVTAPGAAATLTLRNELASEANIQIRVFRWSQSDGKETLEPTTDVVASPPAVTMSPGKDYIARIVRVTKRPVSGEEAYRIFIDQLPEPAQKRAQTVNLLVRYSIPAFFTDKQGGAPSVRWSLTSHQGDLVLSAQNDGDRRLRLSSVRLKDSSEATISFGSGLLGYVLNRSLMSWTVPGGSHAFRAGGLVSITAESDRGPIHAEASSPPR